MTAVQITLREWESIGPGTKQPIAELCDFRFAKAERTLAESLTAAGTITFVERYDGLQIHARAHVGRLQLGRLTLSIVPKIGVRDLLALVRYTYGLRDLQLLSTSRYATTGELLQDLLIAQLYGEVRALLERGIARSYVQHAEDLSSPRGRIDFGRLAQHSSRAAASLPCIHYLRASDHTLNRAVLAGVHHARVLTCDSALRLDLARLHKAIAELAQIVPLSAALLSTARRKLDRLTAPYASILRLIELLYAGNRLELEDEHTTEPLPGFLFNMNLFFQALLSRFLSEHLPPPLQLEPEYRLSELLRYVPGENPKRRRTPTPRPDYAIKRASSVVALLDAKYRDLWNAPLPRDMLYQLSMYALSQPRVATASILYPAVDAEAKAARIEIRDPVRGSTAGYVGLRPVLLSRLVACLAGEGEAGRVARGKLAAELAGV